MKKAILLESQPLDAFAQMALDEAGLDRPAGEDYRLRFFEWPGNPPHGVSFGYSQPFAEAEASAEARFGARLLPLVRRCTGGGVVFHDGDVAFSFIFPWPRLITPSLVYKDIHLGVHLGLKAHAIPTRLWSPPKPRVGNGVECFTAPEGKDLVHEDGTKCLGGALRRRRGVGLYQGSMRPEGFSAAPSKLRQAVLEGFQLQWKLLFRPARPDAALREASDSLRKNRYSQTTWNRKR